MVPPRTLTPPVGLQHGGPQKAAPAPTVRADEGIVVAVVSVTGTVDEVDDLIVPGAYSRTLAEITPKVIKEHVWTDVVGRVLHVEELLPGDPRLPPFTGRGKPWPAGAGALVATMQFNLNTDLGRTAFENAKFFGKDQQFSIGYKAVPMKTRKRRDGVRVIGDLDLWEISTVLWGAHLDTLLLDVKSANKAAEKAEQAEEDLQDAVDTEIVAEDDGDTDEAADAAADVVDAEDDAAEADEEETGLVAEAAITLDMSDTKKGVAARKRAAQKLRAAARARARRDKDQATLTEMDRRDEWDKAIELETLEEQKRRSAYRRKYKLTRQSRNQRVDLAEDERVRRAQWQAQMRRWVRVEKARRRKWSMTMRARSDALASSIRSIEAKTAEQMVLETKAGVPGVADTPEDIKATRRLIRWYEKGEGAALIQWGVDGDHTRCVALAGKHMTTEQAHGFCNLRHKAVLGVYSAEKVGNEHKQHPAMGMEWKSMVEMRGSFEERQRKLHDAVQELLCPKPTDAGPEPVEAGWASVDATFDTKVYATVMKEGGTESYSIDYTFDTEGNVSLGSPEPVELSVVARPEGGMEPEPMSEADAAAARFLTPVLTGYGELALATKTALAGMAGLETKGWKEQLSAAITTLVTAAEEAGIDLDDPEEPDMGAEDDELSGDALDDQEPVGDEAVDPVAEEQAAAAAEDAEADDDDDLAMPGEGEPAGFGVLGDNAEGDGENPEPAPADGEDTAVEDEPIADDGGAEPDEPGIPEDGDAPPAVDGEDDTDAEEEPAEDGDADDDGATDGMEDAGEGAPADEPAATGDPTADDAESGGSYSDDDSEDSDDESDDDSDDDEDMPFKKKGTEKKGLVTLDPAQVIGDLEALRKATS